MNDMKQSIFLAAMAFLALTPNATLAQSVEIGLLAGVNSASVRTDDPEFADITRRSGLIGGGFLTADVLDFLGIRPEFLYTQKGVVVSEGGFEYEINVDYIEVPLLIKLSVPGTGAIRPHLMFGPALSFLSSCWVYDGEDDEEYDCDEVDVFVESRDLSILLAAGVDARLGRLTAAIGSRYAVGTRTVDADPNPIDIKNRTWSITASIAIRLVDL